MGVEKEPRTSLEEILEGDPLTDREIEQLYDGAKGKSAGQSGKELFLSPETVKGYRKRVVAKLAARNFTHAVVIAIGTGVIDISRVLDDE